MSIPGRRPPTKRARRERARAEARERRERQRRALVRRRVLLQVGAALAVLTCVALVGAGIVARDRVAAVGPANMLSDGVVLAGTGTAATVVTTGSLQAGEEPVPTDEDAVQAQGVVTIDVYVDYLCPYCGRFEAANSTQLESWLTSGSITLEIHPVAILDSSSQGTEYSSRAANAVACVAQDDPGSVLAVHDALFAQQPEEGTAGLDDDALRALVTEAGVTDDDVLACITAGTFRGWVADATQRALNGPLANSTVAALTATPTVIVNGEQYTGAPGDASAFLAFVSGIVGADTEATPTTGATDAATAAPAPTP